jgi:hypothetical protein
MASMVVTGASPTLATGVTQERVAAPFRWTVQAPHSAMPQPNFVPVMPRTSRRTHSSGVSPSTSTRCSASLTLIVKAIGNLLLSGDEHDAKSASLFITRRSASWAF